jgi:aspartyl-tRNA synthetase
MHRYRTRTHTCGAIGLPLVGETVRLSGWCHRIRDHGGLLFIDLRDHYGLTQCVVDPDSPGFHEAEKLRSEFVIRVDGAVRKRPAATENPEMSTGMVERSMSARSRCSGRPATSRCRCSATSRTRRTRACATASWT